MNVLFICTANVCRSALAEGYLKHLLMRSPISGVHVSSAGVMAQSGCSAFDCAIEVGRLTGFDLNPHRARFFTQEIANESDLILCMETWHASQVLDLDQNLLSKTALLGKFHPAGNRLLQIPDPRNFTVPHTLEVFDLIQDSVDGLHQHLSALQKLEPTSSGS
jgi:protein-tyrosine phosphatase